MKTFVAIMVLAAVALIVPPSALAKKPKPQPTPSGPELRIVEVSAVSVTVSVSKGGDEHFTYKITDSTKVTLNGAPVAARDLKPGMLAKFSLSSDRETADVIDAKDPPANPAKHRVG